jgi:hypothetical protein
MDSLLQPFLSICQDFFTLVFTRTGVLITPEVALSVPFLLPLLLAASVRSLLTTAAIGLIAWTAANLVASYNDVQMGALFYGAAFLGVCMAAVEFWHSKRDQRKDHEENKEVRLSLDTTQRELERERVWRRATGDTRSGIADDDIIALAQQAIARKEKRPGAVISPAENTRGPEWSALPPPMPS